MCDAIASQVCDAIASQGCDAIALGGELCLAHHGREGDTDPNRNLN